MGLFPDAHGVDDRVVTLKVDVDDVVALAEEIPAVETSLVEDDGIHRVFGLFVFVEVGEAHADALWAVGAVEQHVDVNHVFAEVHALFEAVGPDGLAFARQSQLVDVATRSGFRARTRFGVGRNHQASHFADVGGQFGQD